jgi:hypothetical protein
VIRRHAQPDQPSRQPSETRVNTVKVACARTGPEAVIEEHNTYRQHTLADVEAWCAELRELGAPDDLPLPEADGLVVTLNADGGA